MKRICILVTFICLSLSAAESKNESWYFTFGMGTAFKDIPSANQALFDAQSGADDALSLGYDLGFYFPLMGENTLLGVSMSGSSYSITGSSSILPDYVMYTYLFSISLIKYFHEKAGNGFFFRGDFGVSTLLQGEYGNPSIDESGWGYRAEVGYAFGLSEETRVQLGYYFSDKKITDESFIFHGIQVTLIL